MRLKRESDTLRFTFSAAESQIFQGILQQLAAAYQLKPGDLDSATAAVWYSNRGCASAQMSAEETQEWLAALQGLKAARLPLIESWRRELSAAGPKAQLTLSLENAPAFMAAINDHRLRAAAQHDIGEDEMDIQSPFRLFKLSPERQAALMEIHFLAWILEATLRAIQTSQND